MPTGQGLGSVKELARQNELDVRCLARLLFGHGSICSAMCMSRQTAWPDARRSLRLREQSEAHAPVGHSVRSLSFTSYTVDVSSKMNGPRSPETCLNRSRTPPSAICSAVLPKAARGELPDHAQLGNRVSEVLSYYRSLLCIDLQESDAKKSHFTPLI